MQKENVGGAPAILPTPLTKMTETSPGVRVGDADGVMGACSSSNRSGNKRPAQAAWGRLSTHVESWPLWSESMETVETMDKTQPFGDGQRSSNQATQNPALVWTVVEFEPGVAFAWESSSRGVRTWAGHRIERLGEGQSKRSRASDPPVRPASPYFRQSGYAATRRYVDMEAEGLRKFCESG